jgi:hypothetical protein
MGPRLKTKGAVSASALSQMGVCERLVVFEHCEGKQPTPVQRAALQRGLRAHRHFASEGASEAARTGRCFIVTHVFGEGPETEALRRLRDRFLRQSHAGRGLILGYYRVAPSICLAMKRWPALEVGIRTVLRPMVWLATRLVRVQEYGHGI